MAVALPKNVAIGSSGKFMRYVTETGDSRGYLEFSETQILKTPYTKFELQYPSSTRSNPLVHIRCCYNNVYLAKKDQNSSFIVGEANEREDDQSKWNCTLFEFVPNGTKYKIVHVQSKLHLNPNVSGLLQITQTGSTSYELVDMDTLFTLPKYISFKGDNCKYLQARWIESHEYNEFSSDDIGDKRSRYQVFPLYDGRVRIKSLHYNKFWRAQPHWIWSDNTEITGDNLYTVFFPIKVDGNVIALRNLGGNEFCKRLTSEGKVDCLCANITEINKYARLEVTEAVIRREIFDVTYQTTDARMYNISNVDSVTKDVTNRGTESSVGDVGFSYTRSRSNTWTKTNSWSLGVSVKMTTGIPFIEKGEISIEASYSGEYSWGETHEESKESDVAETVTTPPMTRSVVTMLVQRGTVDIPFTCSQRDTLYDGTIELTREVDGLFTSFNTFVKFDIIPEPLL